MGGESEKGLHGWVEIFRAGRHTDSKGREREFTAADLERIVTTYDPARHEAPAVIGHPQDNSPAWGWVEGLRRAGDRLLARFRQVAPEFAEMVEAGRFKKRSVSLYPDGTLRHVGFLGAQPPAVKGLKDVSFTAGEECSQYEFSEEEDDMGELEDLKKKLADEQSARQKAETAAASYKEKADQATAEFAEAQKKQRRAEIENFVEVGIKDGKLLPAWKDRGLVEFMAGLEEAGGEYEFSEGKKQSPAAWFKAFLSEFAAHPLFREFTQKKDCGDSADHGEHAAGAFDGGLTSHV